MSAQSPRLGFVLYDNRSGSTLLSALLDRYRSISVSPEIDGVAEILDAPTTAPSSRTSSDRELSKVRLRLRRVIDDACDSGGEISHQLIKGPRLHFHLAALSAVFPDCAFIQIVRDGRAVFASKRRTLSPAGGVMDANLLHAAWNWRRKLEMAATLGQRVLTIRYEDLARDPEATVQQALDFLGLDTDQRKPERDVSDFYRDKIPETHRYLHPRIREPIAPDPIDEWRSRLAPHEVLLYETKNASKLEEHGYALDRHGTTQPLGVRLRAYRLYLTGMGRWGLRLVSTAVRNSFTPRVLVQGIRRTYGEIKARRSARSSDR